MTEWLEKIKAKNNNNKNKVKGPDEERKKLCLTNVKGSNRGPFVSFWIEDVTLLNTSLTTPPSHAVDLIVERTHT